MFLELLVGDLHSLWHWVSSCLDCYDERYQCLGVVGAVASRECLARAVHRCGMAGPWDASDQ